MKLLNRYKKQKNGFEQLLKLIESSNPQKQDSFLKMIREEDPSWSELIKTKMLTVERIFSWPEDRISPILNKYPGRLVAVAIYDKHEQYRQPLEKVLNRINYEELCYELDNREFSAAEISAAQAQLITRVRNLIEHGQLEIDSFDPTLVYRNDAA